MSVSLNFTLTEASNSLSLSFYETTGAFATDNLGGYGLPNFTIASAQTATLSLLTNLSATPVLINLFPSSFPTTDDTQVYTITNTILGYGTGKITDQIMPVTYTVTGIFNSVPYTLTKLKYIGIFNDLECCKQKLLAKAAKDSLKCSCDDKKECSCGCKDIVWQATRFDTLFTSMEDALCDGDIASARCTFAELQKICNCNIP